jgi:glycosyltransferase involved in cell wall biosynthesis
LRHGQERSDHVAGHFGRAVPRLSLIVITKNEENALGRCLRSASFADEIVVVDNGSADKTVEIARSLGARIVETVDWPGFGPQKNRALDAATGDWVLSLDADEWIEPPLIGEIRTVLAHADGTDGYEIPRRSRFCGTIVRHCGWSPDYVRRLFRRECGRFSDDKVHEHVEINGKIGRLKNPIEHDSITDLADAAAKIDRYAKVAAGELAAKGKRSSYLKAWLRGLGAFLRTYLWRFGFLDGRIGWLVADYNRRYTYEKWARLAENTD